MEMSGAQLPLLLAHRQRYRALIEDFCTQNDGFRDHHALSNHQARAAPRPKVGPEMRGRAQHAEKDFGQRRVRHVRGRVPRRANEQAPPALCRLLPEPPARRRRDMVRPSMTFSMGAVTCPAGGMAPVSDPPEQRALSFLEFRLAGTPREPRIAGIRMMFTMLAARARVHHLTVAAASL